MQPDWDRTRLKLLEEGENAFVWINERADVVGHKQGSSEPQNQSPGSETNEMSARGDEGA